MVRTPWGGLFRVSQKCARGGDIGSERNQTVGRVLPSHHQLSRFWCSKKCFLAIFGPIFGVLTPHIDDFFESRYTRVCTRFWVWKYKKKTGKKPQPGIELASNTPRFLRKHPMISPRYVPGAPFWALVSPPTVCTVSPPKSGSNTVVSVSNRGPDFFYRNGLF